MAGNSYPMIGVGRTPNNIIDPEGIEIGDFLTSGDPDVPIAKVVDSFYLGQDLIFVCKRTWMSQEGDIIQGFIFSSVYGEWSNAEEYIGQLLRNIYQDLSNYENQ